MAKLNHPGIIQFFGYNLDNEEDVVSILMQYAPNDTLTSIIRGKRGFPGDNTARQKILIGLARAMQYLHKKHILHRDLKPDNILVGGNFHPLIADFGLDKISVTGQTATNNIETPYYEAPEIFVRKPVYDVKVDVYSFAMIMYEIITGLKPYEANPDSPKIFNSFVQYVKNDNRPLFPEKMKINPKIKELIEKCWSGNPKERPTFEEIFEKLAFGSSNQIYEDIFNDDLATQYFIDTDVDSDEVSNYVDYLFTQENTADQSIRQTLEEIKQRVESIRQDSELQINEIKTEMKSFKERLKVKL